MLKAIKNKSSPKTFSRKHLSRTVDIPSRIVDIPSVDFPNDNLYSKSTKKQMIQDKLFWSEVHLALIIREIDAWDIDVVGIITFRKSTFGK